MNAPDRLDAIRVPAGLKKVVATKDEKAANAYVYKVMREDHTLGNLMRMWVLSVRRNPRALLSRSSPPRAAGSSCVTPACALRATSTRTL